MLRLRIFPSPLRGRGREPQNGDRVRGPIRPSNQYCSLSCDLAKYAELERLRRAPRRRVDMAQAVDEDEGRADRFGECLRIVAHHRQSAAMFRAVAGEGGDDCVPAGLECRAQALGIGGSLLLRGQEMKGRAIMPDVILAFSPPLRHIVDDPLDPQCGIAQSRLRRIDFTGNTTTRDKVIRREILIDEGQVFNNQYWEMSILRLNQLGLKLRQLRAA